MVATNHIVLSVYTRVLAGFYGDNKNLTIIEAQSLLGTRCTARAFARLVLRIQKFVCRYRKLCLIVG